MSAQSLDDLARRLQELPREAWDRPKPPPAPWPSGEAPERASTRRRRLVLRPVAVAAASLVLVGAGVGAGLLIAGGDEATAPAPQQVELEPLDGAGPNARGTVDLDPKAGGSATVSLTGLEPSEDDGFYEVWLLGADGELVSLGSVRVPESGEATLEDVQLPVDPQRFRFLDVSREAGDGDPGHSGDSVLRGPSA